MSVKKMNIKIPTMLFGVDGKEALERILAEKDEEPRPSDNGSPPIVKARYDIIKDLTYGQAMDVLRQDYAAGRIPNHPTYLMLNGAKAVRALTMKETALAKMNNYETLKDTNGSTRSDEERLALFKTWSFTSTGIAYQKKPLIKSVKCKIIPVSKNLVTIAEDYNQAYIPIKYDNMNGAEIDTSTGKYHQPLVLNEVLKNAGWIESFEQDQKTLSDYTHLTFKLLNNPEQAMGFWIIPNPKEDHLRALALNILDNHGYALGHDNLYNYARFVRVNPP